MFQSSKQSIQELSYRAGAVIALVFCLSAFFLCFFLLGETNNSWRPVVFVALLAVALLAAGIFFAHKVQQLTQKRRDDLASIIFKQRAGNAGKFALFLRPFYVTGKLKVDVLIPIYSGQPAPTTYQTLTFHLEETINAAFKKVMPIVALGKPGEVHGVGRILVDESTWKPAASDLMRRASLIICIPSSHPGTVWELDEIVKNSYLSKVVFLMPPDPADPEKFFSIKWRAMLDDWNLAATHMKNQNIVVPDYREEGILFAFRPEAGCFIEKLDLSSSRSLRKALLRLSAPLPSSKRWQETTPRQSLFGRIMTFISRIKTTSHDNAAPGREAGL
jgi:hypothetical protein